MAIHTSTYSLPSGDRKLKRQALILQMLKELPGTGMGNEASRYQYDVETYKNYTIFLTRPTRLNKGFDFTVNIKGLYFKKNRRYSNPSHQNICDALSDCKTTFPTNYNQVKSAIDDIYNCNDVALPTLNATFKDHDGTSHDIQIILLAIKWLFMEQDCAYWNYSGRKMLFDYLSGQGLV